MRRNPSVSGKAVLTVDAGTVTGPSVLRNHGLGQGGLSDDHRMISDHVSQLKNLNPKYIRLFLQEYYDVYPKHKVYDWKKLDATVDAILATGAKPLMSICLKPPVLYPVSDQRKVHPTSYPEWDELIYRMVRHYNVERKDGIVYWEVFNEPNIGESGGCPGLFAPGDYCTYYEHTVKAIRRADPGTKVGGPALAGWESPIEEPWLAYCRRKKLPVDFVSWHFYSDDPETPSRGAEHFRKLLAKYPGPRPEFIIDEWNIGLDWKRTEPEFQVCFIPETINSMIKAGIDYSNYYQIRDFHVPEEPFKKIMSPDGARFMINYWNNMLQRFGLFDFQGVMRPAYFVFKMLGRMTGDFVKVSTNSTSVKAFATYDAGMQVLHVLAWNFSKKTPPAGRVSLKLKGLRKKAWNYKRYTLDVHGASNMENDRMRLERAVEETTEGFDDTFTLGPYGISFITVVGR
jgi:hypothetical protein